MFCNLYSRSLFSGWQVYAVFVGDIWACFGEALNQPLNQQVLFTTDMKQRWDWLTEAVQGNGKGHSRDLLRGGGLRLEEFELSASKYSVFVCWGIFDIYICLITFIRSTCFYFTISFGEISWVLSTFNEIRLLFSPLFRKQDPQIDRLWWVRGWVAARQTWLGVTFFCGWYQVVSFEHRFLRDVLCSLDIFGHFALIKPYSCFLFFSLMLDMLAAIYYRYSLDSQSCMIWSATTRTVPPYPKDSCSTCAVNDSERLFHFLALYQPLWT